MRNMAQAEGSSKTNYIYMSQANTGLFALVSFLLK